MSSVNSLGNLNLSGAGDLRSARTAARRVADDARLTEETHTPAPELMHLLNTLRQIPQLRQEVIGEVAQRLAGGDLLTPEATEGTVKAILSGEMPEG